jgi:hypothetical protein
LLEDSDGQTFGSHIADLLTVVHPTRPSVIP